MADASDDLGVPCDPSFDRAPELTDAASLVVQTGAAHGLFYRLDPVWVAPLRAWIAAD